MIFRLSACVVLVCGVGMAQPASPDVARKRFPPEVSLTDRKGATVKARRLCAYRQPQAGTVTFGACPAAPGMRLVAPLGKPVETESPEKR